MKIFDSTLIYPIFDVESIGDGPRVPRAHLEVVLTQLLVARARALYSSKHEGDQRGPNAGQTARFRDSNNSNTRRCVKQCSN